MPIDPTISLRVETPRSMSFADLMKGRLAVQNAIQQRELGQQQRDLNIERINQERQLARHTALQNSAEEQHQKSQEAYLNAVADANGDPDKLESALKTAPLTPEHRITANKQIEDTRARKLKSTAEQQTMEDQHKEQFGQGVRAVRDLPVDQRLQPWQQLLDEAAKTVDPVTNKPYALPEGLSRDAVPDDNQLTTIERVLRGQKRYDAANQAEVKARRDASVDAAKRLRELHTDAADAFEGTTDAAVYEGALSKFAAIDEDHANYAKRFLTSLRYSPESLNVIARRGLTPAERQRADDAEKGRKNRRPGALEIGIDRARDELGEDASEADVIALGQKYYAETEKSKKVQDTGAKSKTREPQDIEEEKNAAMATAMEIEDLPKRAVALNKAQTAYERAIIKNGGQVTANPRYSVRNVKKTVTQNGKPVEVTESELVSPFKSPAAPAVAQASASKTVKMKAPDGTERDVPENQVEKFEKLGAKRVE